MDYCVVEYKGRVAIFDYDYRLFKNHFVLPEEHDAYAKEMVDEYGKKYNGEFPKRTITEIFDYILWCDGFNLTYDMFKGVDGLSDEDIGDIMNTSVCYVDCEGKRAIISNYKPKFLSDFIDINEFEKIKDKYKLIFENSITMDEAVERIFNTGGNTAFTLGKEKGYTEEELIFQFTSRGLTQEEFSRNTSYNYQSLAALKNKQV